MENNKQEMVGQIIDQLEDLLSDKENVLFEGEVYDKASAIILNTLDNWSSI